jgi:hypothetical protein
VEEPLASYADFAVAPDVLKAHIGEYRSGEGEQVNVAYNEDGLFLTLLGTDFPLRPVGEDSFVLRMPTGLTKWVRFVRDETGSVIRLAFHFRQLIKQQAGEVCHENA